MAEKRASLREMLESGKRSSLALLMPIIILGGITVEDIAKPIWPMILYLLAVLMLVTYVPALSMTLPILLGLS